MKRIFPLHRTSAYLQKEDICDAITQTTLLSSNQVTVAYLDSMTKDIF